VSVIAIVRVLIVVCLGMGMVLSVPHRRIKRRQRKAGTYITRACAAATAGIALAAVGVTGASASGAAPRALQTVRVTGAGASLAATSPGAQLWVKRYDNPGNGGATSVAVSPDGKTVFVTGYTTTAGGTEDYTTVAYNDATGAQLWASRYNDPGHTTDQAYSVAVSPDGKAVFVTGESLPTTGKDYATVAYNAATGAQLWAARYNGPSNNGAAAEVAVSPDSKAVFVTGTSLSATAGEDYATVAYNAATGARLWAARYDGFRGNYAHAVAVSPNGKTVFVTGASIGTNNGYDYATVAYSAATGAQLWVNRYNGASNGERGANSVAVSPSGKTVFVTGSSYGGSTANYDYYTTIAYNAATGARLWLARYNGPANFTDEAYSVAVRPGGGTVYVTGESAGTDDGWDYATVAYNATTGAQLWVKRYDGAGLGAKAFSVAVSPTAGTVFVTGYSVDVGSDYATVAYKG
jgi:outer membrane protein assembly factor BamB